MSFENRHNYHNYFWSSHVQPWKNQTSYTIVLVIASRRREISSNDIHSPPFQEQWTSQTAGCKSLSQDYHEEKQFSHLTVTTPNHTRQLKQVIYVLKYENRRKHFIKVNTFLLIKTSYNKSCFIPCTLNTRDPFFSLKDPLATNDSFSYW